MQKLALLLATLSLLLAPSCATRKLEVSAIPVPLTGFSVPLPKIPLRLPNVFFFFQDDTNLEHLSWVEAFDALHARLSVEYPFTAWKGGVAWDALHARFRPEIETAEAAGDEDAYYLSLRRYLHSVRDGHVTVETNETLRAVHAGAWFGLEVVALDDGRVVAKMVSAGGPASSAEILPGAQILAVNGRPATEALEAVDTIWADVPPATAEGLRLTQLDLLFRDSPGATREITYLNPGETERQTVNLRAIAKQEFGERNVTVEDAPIESRTLEPGYGYLRIAAIAPTLEMPFPEKALQRMIGALVEAKTPGLVIDLRGTVGGANNLVPMFAGFFYDAPGHYEDVAVYDKRKKDFSIDERARLPIPPLQPYFDGPVVLLVDAETMGSAEGLAMALARRPNAQVLGFHGTHGSSGILGGSVMMPGELLVNFPTGRSLDADGKIQLETNGAGEGGVTLDVRVPVDEAVVRAISEGRDVLLEKAVERLDSATWRFP